MPAADHDLHAEYRKPRAAQRVWAGVVLSCAAVAVAGWWGSRILWPPVRPRPLVIMASGDTAGWIMPCGCTANQSGGLARRGTFFNRVRQSADLVAVDVGGAPGGTSPYDRVKFRAILRGEIAMAIAAHNIGSAEAALGAAELRRLVDETAIPLVSTNVRDADGRPVASPLRIVAGGGRRIAVFGVLAPQLTAGGLRVVEPRTAVLEALTKARGTYDVAVVLAYLPTAELEAFAAEMPEVDLVIGGPTRQTIAPRRLGPTWLVSVTNKGKFLARFDVAASDDGQPWQGSIVEMGPELADDPAQIANLQRYHRELAELDFTASQTLFAAVMPPDLPADYQVVGTESCRHCHAEDCRVWDKSKHSRAWQTLVDRGYNFDSYCQQCHTTGYSLPGGFVSVGRSSLRTAVGCESCHGPGAAHAARPQTRTTFNARDQCVHCHDHENSPAFELDKYWQKIFHGPAAIKGEG